MIKVTHFNRKHKETGSIENLFRTIRKFMPSDIDISLFIPSYRSQGLYKRLYIIIQSYFNQADVNHITGDIHFVSYLMKKKKTILTIHDCVALSKSRGLKHKVLKLFWFTLAVKKVKYITVISEKTKKELLEYISFPEDKIFVIPNCISDNFHYVEQEYFNKVKPRILQIGTKDNKNLIRICKALKGENCILDIVGKLSEEQLKALVDNNIEHENSFDIGEDELIKKYTQSDIIAFVSTYEGFGMPILEAQTIGRAILTSNISPMLEVGKDGACYVNPYNINDIRGGFKKIISDDVYRSNLIKSGVENSLKYKPQEIANMYADLYKKVYEEEN